MKMTLRFVLLIAVLIGAFFVSCKKEYKSRICDTPSQVECGFDTSLVNVRVWNKTGYPLCNFRAKYRTDIPDTLRYGTLDIEEISCYVGMDFIKVFPRVRFELGTGAFKTPDSLAIDTLPYNNVKETSPGFYTFYIQMGGPLDSLYIYTFLTKDAI